MISKIAFAVLLAAACFAVETSVESRLRSLEQKQELSIPRGSNQFNVEGDFLYWKASVDGVEYAVTTHTEQSDIALLITNKFKTRAPHFSFHPGYRLKVGYQSPEEITFNIIWTDIKNKGKDTAHGSKVVTVPFQGFKLIQPSSFTAVIKSLTTPGNLATVSCHLDSKWLDFLVGKNLHLSRYFRFTPQAGVKVFWQRANWDVKDSKALIIPHFLPQDEMEIFTKNRFNAAGLELAFDAKWLLPRNFGLFVSGSGALVYGRTSEKTKQNYFYLPDGETELLFQQFNAKRAMHSTKSLWSLATGLFWEVVYKAFQLRMDAGYEFQYWPKVGQRNIQQLRATRERYDISYHGYTFGLRLGF